MANFIYSTSNRIHTRFLLDSAELLKLDGLLNKEWERLTAMLDQKYQSELETKFSNDSQLASFNTDKRKNKIAINERKQKIQEDFETWEKREFKKEKKITLELSKTKKVEVESFEKALKSTELQDEAPKGFNIEMTCGELRLNIELDDYGLNYRVSPENLPDSRDVFAVFDDWAKSNYPPIWQTYWYNSLNFHWIIFWLGLGFALIFVTSASDAAKSNYRTQAYQLLQEGINPENQQKAIEVILALQSNYLPPGYQSPPQTWFWYFIIILCIICLALTFKPKSTLGIGKGKNYIKHWNIWIKWIFIIIPTLIFRSYAVEISEYFGLAK